MQRFVRRIIKKINTKTQSIIGSVKHDAVKVYWYDHDVNFGDLLTPMLLKKYGLRPIHSQKNCADVISVGSVLDNLWEEFPGTIAGSGLVQDRGRKFPYATILGVRGELTRERIQAPKSVVLGDPGLLADILIERQKKQFLIGIIPHYTDKFDKRVHSVIQRNIKDIKFIDVQRNPKSVISDIDKCSYILSSSLHGIVVADSLGIPNAWILLSDRVVGKGFKFFDYGSAIGIEIVPHSFSGYEDTLDLIKMTRSTPNEIYDTKIALDSMFKKLSFDVLKNNQKLLKPKLL